MVLKIKKRLVIIDKLKKPRNKRLVIIDKPKKTTAHLLMPDVISKVVHDFIRPNKNKKIMDKVVEELRIMGDHMRSPVFGTRWCLQLDDWECDLLICNRKVPERLEWVNDDDWVTTEFISVGIGDLMLMRIDELR